jgi:MoxR-like ATPase
VLQAVGTAFVGRPDLLEKVLAGTIASGHILFEDYPGLGKTVLVKSFAKALGLDHRRLQFTPDVLPADILGTKIWNPATRTFELHQGPLFTNLILADEINRAPPKTQSALLEAMEERQVTIEGNTLPLPKPFLVLATQNPIEQEGTYPLPEAQMDRFLMRLSTGYPVDLAAEHEILRRRVRNQGDDPTRLIQPVATKQQFAAWQASVEKEVHIHDVLLQYIASLVRRLREHPKVDVGPSPRGSLALVRASRALAFVRGRNYVTPDDIVDLAADVLAHRTLVKVDQAIEGVQAADIVREAIEAAPPASL